MSTASLEATEAVGARGATRPRVMLSDIEQSIAFVNYATADSMLPPGLPPDAAYHAEPMRILTICTVVLFNDFVVIGTSAPASPENFDAEKGREFAYEDAVRKIWPLMGFALRDRLHRDQVDTAAYMRATGQDGPAQTAVVEEQETFQEGEDLAGMSEGAASEEDLVAVAGEGTKAPLPPPPIEDDETLEAAGDQYIVDLINKHGLEYVDRADAIGKLKAKRDSILPSHNAANGGQPNAV